MTEYSTASDGNENSTSIKPSSGDKLHVDGFLEELNLIEFTRRDAHINDDHKVGIPVRDGDLTRTPLEGKWTALRITEWGANRTIILALEDGISIPTKSLVFLAPTTNAVLASQAPSANSFQPFAPTGWPNMVDITARGPAHTIQPSTLHFETASTATFYLTGVEILLSSTAETRTISTGTWANSSNPAGNSPTLVAYKSIALEGRVRGSISAEMDAGTAYFLASNVRVENVESLAVPLAAARFEIPNQSYGVNASHLRLDGRFTVFLANPSAGQTVLRATVEGDVRSWTTDKQSTMWLSADLESTVTALGLMALLVTVAAGLRNLLATILRNRADPIRHPTRQGILKLLQENPGLSMSELSAKTGGNRWTIRHHVEVLTRARFLPRIVAPDAHRFVLLGNTKGLKPDLRGGRESEFSPLILRQQTRQRVYMFLCQNGGLTYASFCAWWKGTVHGKPPVRRTVLHHLAKLQAAGLVIREGAGRATTWKRLEKNSAQEFRLV